MLHNKGNQYKYVAKVVWYETGSNRKIITIPIQIGLDFIKNLGLNKYSDGSVWEESDQNITRKSKVAHHCSNYIN